MVWDCVFVFKQKTAYEMRISDWSSDVCSSDLHRIAPENPGITVDRETVGHARDIIADMADGRAFVAVGQPRGPIRSHVPRIIDIGRKEARNHLLRGIGGGDLHRVMIEIGVHEAFQISLLRPRFGCEDAAPPARGPPPPPAGPARLPPL